MATLINLYNQAGAGPKTLALTFIKHLSEQLLNERFYILVPDFQEYALLESTNPYIHFIKLPRKEKLLNKILFRLYLELFLISKLTKRYQVDQLLAFGSFLLTRGSFTKLVLVHHPYLFDNKLLASAPVKIRIQEYLKRFAFFITLLNTKHLVVESQYVADSLKNTWQRYLIKNHIHIISNPVSDNIGKLTQYEFETFIIPVRLSHINNVLSILFVSRFYPHKNHKFLIGLSRALTKHGIKHQILVTVNEEIFDAKLFLESIANEKLCIKNLGEISQIDLQEFYRSTHLFMFPSKSETFGIPMIEAMAYGLPLVLPKLGYAEAIAGDAGNYYQNGDTESCVKIIADLTKQPSLYKQRSKASFEAISRFPTPAEWVSRYLDTLRASAS